MGCIGGLACAVWGEGTFGEYDAIKALTDGVVSFDDTNKLNRLFYPPPAMSWNWITRAIAAEAIREFIATGKVNWLALEDKHNQ